MFFAFHEEICYFLTLHPCTMFYFKHIALSGSIFNVTTLDGNTGIKKFYFVNSNLRKTADEWNLTVSLRVWESDRGLPTEGAATTEQQLLLPIRNGDQSWQILVVFKRRQKSGTYVLLSDFLKIGINHFNKRVRIQK